MHSITRILMVAGLAMSSHAALANDAPATAGGFTEVYDTGRYQAPNKAWFTFVKGVKAGEETTIYTNVQTGEELTFEGLSAWQQANPPARVDEALTSAAAQQPAKRFRVMIRLATNPWKQELEQVRELNAPKLDALRTEIQDIHRSLLPTESMDTDAEKAWQERHQMGLVRLNATQELRVSDLSEQIEDIENGIRAQVRTRVIPLIAADQAALVQTIAKLGGEVKDRLIAINALTVELPGASVAALNADPMVLRAWEIVEGTPEIDTTMQSIGAQNFWNAGFTGTSWDFGTLDSGCQQNHPCFAGVQWDTAPGVLTTDLTDGHGTSVGSIITSRNATFRGAANNTDNFLVGYASDFYADGDWMVSTASDDPEAINVSWRLGDADLDDYTDIEMWVDALIDDNDLMLVKSCGNRGPSDTTLTRPGTAYNCMSVANMTFNGTVTRGDDFITGSSSRGPTESGRKKPDLTAPSQGCTAANAFWETAADWTGFGGTSGAAPHVTGTFMLLTHMRGSSTPYVNKAIILNAADAWSDADTATTTDDGPVFGSHWDKVFGWGYLDAGEAHTNGLDVFTRTNGDASSASPRFRLFRGTMFSNEKATLVWNKHDTYNGTSIPTGGLSLTDMDLYAYNAETNASLGSSLTVSNNVEQVGLGLLLLPDTSRDVVLKVRTFTTAIDGAGNTETYALATEENFVEVAPITFGGAILPDEAHAGTQAVVRVVVGNQGDAPAHDVTVTLSLPAGWTLASGANPQNIGTISDGGFLPIGVAEFVVDIPCGAVGSPSVGWSVSSSSYGETFTGSGSETIQLVAPIALAENVSQSFAEVSKTFSFPVSASEFSYVAIEPGGSDLDIKGDGNSCFTSPWQTSSFGGTTRDFLVVNGYTQAASTQFANVFRFSGNVPAFDVEFDRGFDTTLASVPVANTWEADEVVEPYELPLTAGRRYKINGVVSSGNIDISMHVFAPTAGFSRRALAADSVDLGGSGAGETLFFTPVTTGVHSIGLINENAGSGSTSFSVRCAADFNGVGGLTPQDIFDFLNAWFALSLEADFDGSGSLAPADIFDFLNAWFAGC